MLTVQGTNFTTDSQVRWNGVTLVTTLIGATELQATAAASLTARFSAYSMRRSRPPGYPL
jgi:hypothetical protein